MIGTSLMPPALLRGPLGADRGPAMQFAAPSDSSVRVVRIAKAAAGSADRFKRLYLWRDAVAKWGWKRGQHYAKAYGDLRAKYVRDVVPAKRSSLGPWPPLPVSRKPPHKSAFGL